MWLVVRLPVATGFSGLSRYGDVPRGERCQLLAGEGWTSVKQLQRTVYKSNQRPYPKVPGNFYWKTTATRDFTVLKIDARGTRNATSLFVR